MGHTRPNDLKDVQDILKPIRSWQNIREKSPNIFYYKSIPFLHFHDKDGQRWADVKDGKDWGSPIQLPFAANAKQKQAFLKEVLKRYQTLHLDHQSG